MTAPISSASTAARWLPGLDGIAYGGDYNPEQWPEEVWAEDVRLMGEAGVNLVSVGIFSWALLEPAEGRFEFGWLDRLLDLLHGGGIAVDLATPTAAPPPWFTRRYPASRPVTREGVVLGTGARATFCPSSPDYAAACVRIAEQLARRYGRHPAVVLWHVHNEYAGHIHACYCDTCAAAFRVWLRDRHGDLAGLNRAWGTAFWGQRYGDWEEIDPPRMAPTVVNPAQQLDYQRFASDAFLACYLRERDVLRRLAPGIPITTNFMATSKPVDYWRWAGEVDVVANDHYLAAERADNHIDLAMAADLTRSLAGGRPWMLMEHSTSAVNWQARNIAKRPGEMRRNSLAHLARGADAVLFFQWRAPASGAEKFHSTMLPRGGTDSRQWREVVRLGADLAALRDVRGSRVDADAAIVWDWESWWALELEWRPSADVRYLERVQACYERLWRANLTADFVHPEADLSRYPLVLAPSLYLTTPAAARNLASYVEAGGTLMVSFFSGIADANDAIPPGRFPGALRDLLGLEIEEFLPLRAGETVRLEGGLRADVWAEDVLPRGAEPVLRYLDGPAAGGPAVTRHRFGRGRAWYVSTRLCGAHLARVLERVYADAGLSPGDDLPAGLEVVRRDGERASFVALINHGGEDVVAPVRGVDHLTGEVCDGTAPVPAGAVRILRQER